MSRKHFKGGTLTAPLPPVLVTVGEEDRANVLTVAWTGILASDPPKTYVSIRPSRHSYEILKEGGEFVINLPSDNLAKAVDCAGIFTGAKVDKFQKCGFTKTESRTVAPQTIAECPVALECRVTEVIPMGTHDVFFADILDVSCDERLLDEKGKIHMERAHLLAYAHGEYFALGRRLGTFGFSAVKKKKRPAPPAKHVAKESADAAKAHDGIATEDREPREDIPDKKRGKDATAGTPTGAPSNIPKGATMSAPDGADKGAPKGSGAPKKSAPRKKAKPGKASPARRAGKGAKRK